MEKQYSVPEIVFQYPPPENLPSILKKNLLPCTLVSFNQYCHVRYYIPECGCGKKKVRRHRGHSGHRAARKAAVMAKLFSPPEIVFQYPPPENLSSILKKDSLPCGKKSVSFTQDCDEVRFYIPEDGCGKIKVSRHLCDLAVRKPAEMAEQYSPPEIVFQYPPPENLSSILKKNLLPCGMKSVSFTLNCPEVRFYTPECGCEKRERLRGRRAARKAVENSTVKSETKVDILTVTKDSAGSVKAETKLDNPTATKDKKKPFRWCSIKRSVSTAIRKIKDHILDILPATSYSLV